MPAARQATKIQLRSPSVFPSSPTYQIARSSRPEATAAAITEPSQTAPS